MITQFARANVGEAVSQRSLFFAAGALLAGLNGMSRAVSVLLKIYPDEMEAVFERGFHYG